MSDILQYRLFKTGQFSNIPLNVMAFLNTKINTMNVPDIQFHFFPSLFNPEPKTKKWVDRGSALATFENLHHDHLIPNWPQHGLSVLVVLLHPQSIGSIKLSSSDPLVPPLINANYLSVSHDTEALLEGTKLCRDMMKTAAIKGVIKRLIHDDTVPYPIESDEYIRDRIRNYAGTLYHPVGTCKMGPSSDRMSVVDPQLRVHGIKRLRVVDASIMPTLVSGNTHIPSIMIAEKAFDMIIKQSQNTPQSKL